MNHLRKKYLDHTNLLFLAPILTSIIINRYIHPYFYVNNIGNSFQSPNQVTKVEYLKSLRIVKELLAWLSFLPTIEQDNEVQVFYKTLKKQ